MAAVRHIGVLTSGGDAPGMNAAIRAVVRTAIARGLEITGVVRGYTGLIAGEFRPLDAHSVSNIIQLGGTVLKTSRCQEFFEPGGRAKAAGNLADAGIDGLVVIGGDGSFQGLHLLATEHGVRAVGIPGTIDNDIYGTDFTVGFHTAVNTALESIDKIRDTSASHDRVFFIEVMGRTSGSIALVVGTAGGAEEIVIPEEPMDLERICATLEAGQRRGKESFIIVVAEGAVDGGARSVAEAVSEKLHLNYRVSILGHVQRGGSPTSHDRTLASRLGVAAVEAIDAGRSDVMVGGDGWGIGIVPLVETWQRRDPLPGTKEALTLELLRVARITGT
jgi:6-phosphofructokinase 1